MLGKGSICMVRSEGLGVPDGIRTRVTAVKGLLTCVGQTWIRLSRVRFRECLRGSWPAMNLLPLGRIMRSL